MGHYSERERLKYRLNAAVRKAIRLYNLIQDGDRLLIGLSGGKDSLSLVHLLGDLSQIFRPLFKVSAVHVVMDGIPYRSDIGWLGEHCRSHQVDFKVKYASSFPDETEEPSGGRDKSVCFRCSWNRRKALFETAKELDCNKIVLGHHRDDFLETLLLNMLFQGSIQAIPPKLKMDRFPMEIIRPLCLVSEIELQQFALGEGYRLQEKSCPYEHVSHRTEVRQLLESLEDKHPGVRDSLWASMQHIYPRYLPSAVSEMSATASPDGH